MKGGEDVATTSPVVADALALYLGIFLRETLEDETSIVKTSSTWSVIFDTLTMLSKHRSGCVHGCGCLLFLLRSTNMRSKVPLSVCHTLVDYVLSPHASNVLPKASTKNSVLRSVKGNQEVDEYGKSATTIVANSTENNSKDERYSALDVCALLKELHLRCRGLLEKYAGIGRHTEDAEDAESGNSNNNSIDAWNDVWKPILISMARCTQSSHESVVKTAMLMLESALLNGEHGDFLSGAQWIRVHDELVFPLITSICQTSAAATAQAALGSPNNSNNQSTLAWPIEQRSLALSMLSRVIARRSDVMSLEEGWLQVWAKAVRTTSEFGEKSSGKEVRDMVESMKKIGKYDENVKAVTSATLRPEVYSKIMELSEERVEEQEKEVRARMEAMGMLEVKEIKSSSPAVPPL